MRNEYSENYEATLRLLDDRLIIHYSGSTAEAIIEKTKQLVENVKNIKKK